MHSPLKFSPGSSCRARRCPKTTQRPKAGVWSRAPESARCKRSSRPAPRYPWLGAPRRGPRRRSERDSFPCPQLVSWQLREQRCGARLPGVSAAAACHSPLQGKQERTGKTFRRTAISFLLGLHLAAAGWLFLGWRPRPPAAACADLVAPARRPGLGVSVETRERSGERVPPCAWFQLGGDWVNSALSHGGPPGTRIPAAPCTAPPHTSRWRNWRLVQDCAAGGLARTPSAQFLHPAFAPPPPPPNRELLVGICTESAAASRAASSLPRAPRRQHSQRRVFREQSFHLQHVRIFSAPEWTTDVSGTLEKVLLVCV